MKKRNLTLKETFVIALKNYKEKNFTTTEKLCKEVITPHTHANLI